jgi:DNA-binding response OmpR family regulator
LRRILIIDNESYIQELVKMCLETVAGWEILTASSGREGIGIAETEQPDAILLDVMMPDMDGATTFAKLQKNSLTNKIPVIFLTAKIQAADRLRYEEMGIDKAIAKPFNPLELASTIETQLGWD